MTRYVDWKDNLKKDGKLAEVQNEKSRAFDIAYAQERAYLIKVIYNIESLSREKAALLKKCASVVGAEPVVISERGKEKLKDNVVYNRYGINVMHHDTLVNLINGEHVFLAERGGIKSPITGLQVAREEMGMSRLTLSKLLGVSVEMVRKYEKGAAPNPETAKRLEDIFGEKIYGEIKTEVPKLKRVFIGKAPFDLGFVKHKKTTLVSFKDKKERVRNLKNVSDVLDAEPVIAEKLDDLDL